MKNGLAFSSLLAGTASFVLLLASSSALAARNGGKAARPRPTRAAAKCAAGDVAVIWWSPQEPQPGSALRILAVSESARDADLKIALPGGAATPAIVRRGGPPFSLEGDVDKAASGNYRVEVVQAGKVVGCRNIHVALVARRARGGAREDRRQGRLDRAPRVGSLDGESVLGVRRAAVRCAARQVGRLSPAAPGAARSGAQFSLRPPRPARGRPDQQERDPRDARLRRPAVLPARVLLVEDRPAVWIPRLRSRHRRASAALWRHGDQRIGDGQRQGHAGAREELLPPGDQPRAVGQRAHRARRRQHRLLPGEAGTIGAAAGRDLRRSLRPRDDDREVGRSDRRSRAACCWPSTGSPTRRSGASGSGRGRSCSPTTPRAPVRAGRRFVPSSRARTAARCRRSSNPAIGGAGDPGHAPFSEEQGKLSTDEFYARMGKLINPSGLDAAAAYGETLDALVEQMKVRVGSVDNGEKFMRDTKNAVVAMPDGAKIFETTGAWEDYATPSRDMRLIIAMNVLTGLRRSDRAPPGAVCAGRAQARGRARRGARAAQTAHRRARDRVPAQRRVAVQDHRRRSARAQDRARDGVQPQRLRRDPLGSEGRFTRACDLPATRARRSDRAA